MLSLFKYDLRRFVATNIELPITYLKKNLSAHGCVAKRFKMLNTRCMLRFFTVSRLALNPNLIFEIGSTTLKNSR